MQLSSSSLSTFCECPRCFYIEKKLGCARPRGIFSSLPNGIDKILKNQMDRFRGKLPEIMDHPRLAGFVLFDNDALMKKYRHWKSSPLKYEDGKGNVLVGALDELLFNPRTGYYAAADWKTKGSEPDQAYCEQYYQKQINIYTFLGECGGLKMSSFGVLQYFFPVDTDVSAGVIPFQSKTFILEANPGAAKDLFDSAIRCLESDIIPPSSSGCEYCSYAAKRGSQGI